MGQRLVTEFIKDDKTFAVLYQHWDAYTETALSNLTHILLALEEKEIKDEADLAYMLYDLFGAWFTPEDSTYITNDKFRLTPVRVNRNSGLFAFDESSKESLKSAGEEYMSVDLDTKTASFGVYWEYYSFDNYCEECIEPGDEEEIEKEKNSIVECKVDTNTVTLKNIMKLRSAFNQAGQNLVHFTKDNTYAIAIG